MVAASEPRDPIAAVTHPDPYPYYACLVAERPLYFDAGIGMWVASSAAAVTSLLSSPACRVRPPDEPVPTALIGSAAGAIFARLARMNDGAAHAAARGEVAALLDARGPARVARECERKAEALARHLDSAPTGVALVAFAFALPVHVVASLLGVPDDGLGAVSAETGALVRCLFPGGSPHEIEAGKAAAESLLARFEDHATGAEPVAVVANAIGLLAQAHDATAGLVCTTLLTLARDPALRESLRRAPDRLGAIVSEVVRFDSPVQNTRRFVAEPTTIEGRSLRPGERVLAVLAAANRDPRANPSPQVFDPSRGGAEVFSFGVGAHACPGRALAVAIATAGVARILAGGFDPARLDPGPLYRASPNARIPLLGLASSARGPRRPG